ncbi:hypothetical protein OfM1_00480 [Lactovum odontotermitis]
MLIAGSDEEEEDVEDEFDAAVSFFLPQAEKLMIDRNKAKKIPNFLIFIFLSIPKNRLPSK